MADKDVYPSPVRRVDNRVFLLGLDNLFREAQKQYETHILFPIVVSIRGDLTVVPQDAPIEGYYDETPELKEYFLIVRLLQTLPKGLKDRVKDKEGLQKLLAYTGSKIFGRLLEEDHFLPILVDPLAEALKQTYPKWNISNITEVASNVSREWDDMSLVGLACLVKDSCAITALRESVVLYVSKTVGAFFDKRRPTYEWVVDKELEDKANIFIREFNFLTDSSLPTALPENAAIFYNACSSSQIVGRCVNIGSNPEGNNFYHWAIDVDSKREYLVKDFWGDHIWTTEEYKRRGQKSAMGRLREYLAIEFLGERKPLALVYPNLDGTFRVESEDPDAREYFSGLINKISQENPTLPLMTGQTERQGNITLEKEIQKQVANTDVEYLSALWDYFNKGKPEYKSRRIRAYTTTNGLGKRDRVVITGSVEETIRKRRATREKNQPALGEMQKLKNAGLFESGVDVEAILETAIPRIHYFEQAVRERQVRRARWMLITGVDPRTLGKNFHEMSYPPLQMNQFYKDVKDYFSPLLSELGLKFELVNPQYHPDGQFEMILKGEKTETKYAEKDPVSAYTWMVGFINTHPDMAKGAHLMNLAPFSGRGCLVLLRNVDGDKLHALEKLLVLDPHFSCGSWSRVYSTAQGMDDVNREYGLIEVVDASATGRMNGIFFSDAKAGLDVIYPNNKLIKALSQITAGHDTEQMPKEYFRQYLVEKLNELDPVLHATFRKE